MHIVQNLDILIKLSFGHMEVGKQILGYDSTFVLERFFWVSLHMEGGPLPYTRSHCDELTLLSIREEGATLTNLLFTYNDHTILANEFTSRHVTEFRRQILHYSTHKILSALSLDVLNWNDLKNVL